MKDVFSWQSPRGSPMLRLGLAETLNGKELLRDRKGAICWSTLATELTSQELSCPTFIWDSGLPLVSNQMPAEHSLWLPSRTLRNSFQFPFLLAML